MHFLAEILIWYFPYLGKLSIYLFYNNNSNQLFSVFTNSLILAMETKNNFTLALFS